MAERPGDAAGRAILPYSPLLVLPYSGLVSLAAETTGSASDDMNTNPPRQRANSGSATAPPQADRAEDRRARRCGPRPARRRRGARAQSRSQIVVFMNFSISVADVLVSGRRRCSSISASSEFDGPGPSTTDRTFMVKPNTGVQDIADQLERRGLISDARIFRIGVRAYGNDAALKAGEYEIKAGASMRDIMELLKSGKSVMYSLTIPEGLTVEQAFQRIAEHDALTGDMPAAHAAGGQPGHRHACASRAARRASRSSTRCSPTRRSWSTTSGRRRVSRICRLADINEFVTLASIVEKETGRGDERSRVASVFINRLNKGMRLQSDPTIIYGLFGGKGKPADRPIYQSDIDKPTPYNTYVIDGLPPTPIANPGRAALEAVANPSKTDDLYFVADGTGGHVFASTLEEHNENVAR